MSDAESNLEKAMDCIEHPPHPGIYTSPGRPFAFHMMNLIREDLPINIEEDKIAVQTVSEELEPILKEAAFQDNPEDVFNDEFERYIKDLRTRNPDKYEIVFPLNLQDRQDPPDEFSVRGTVIHRISGDEWENEYLTPARFEADNLSSFLRKTPNDPLNDEYTFWKVTAEGRGRRYAMFEASNLVKLMLAKINYAFRRWYLRPTSSLPRVQWSRLESPFFLLAFQDSEFQHFHISDYDSRQPMSIPWEHMDVLNVYNSLPEFTGDLSPVDTDIVNSLYEFQDALTARRQKEAFFCFWRGVETLCQTERGQATEDTLNRAVFAAECQQPREEWNEPFDITADEIDEMRNDVAHGSGHVPLSQYHQDFVKHLFDSLLDLYFKYRGELREDEFRYFLEYGGSEDHRVADVESEMRSKRVALDALQNRSCSSSTCDQ